MRIAFISAECPPDTAGGGIGTYVTMAARMMAERGHDVELFSSSPTRAGSFDDPGGFVVHRVGLSNDMRSVFPEAVVPVFRARHAVAPFDVVEGTDYNAEAAGVARAFPSLPIVVKLHTPTHIVSELNRGRVGPLSKLRTYLSAMRGGARPYWIYRRHDDPEWHHARSAHAVAAPSRAIGERIAAEWSLAPDRLHYFPYPFEPRPALLEIPIDTDTNRVTYFGRLEQRKGVLDLAAAIPVVLRRRPDVRFRFIGRPLPSPRPGLDMREHLLQRLGAAAASVEFVDPVPNEELPLYLAETDLCVFPSLWESFGIVCLEAMAAGRGVIASRSGGMAELLAQGEAGPLVAPGRPAAIADAVLTLLADPARRKAFGRISRRRVVEVYGFTAVAPAQEACYQAAIAECRQQILP